VPPELCLETGDRVGADGATIEPLTTGDLALLRQQLQQLRPDAVTINLLFSFLDNSHEKAIKAIVPDNIFVSRSSAILPEYKAYERGITTWLNAWVGPLVQRYLQRLQQKLPTAQISVMQSSGGTIAGGGAGGADAALRPCRWPGRGALCRPQRRTPKIAHLRHGRHLHRCRTH
jgi:N-methylhydantoinase A